MKTLAENFLSPTEQQQITLAIQTAEKMTSGELVPMVVSASHHYPMASVLCGACLATPIALLLTFFLGNIFWIGQQNLWLFLALFCLFYFTFYFLSGNITALKRYFLRENEVHAEVEKAALAAFYQEHLYKTKDQNGLLLYISVLEKKVWILGDRGIDQKIQPETWQSLVTELTKGIRAGDRGDSICGTIKQIGAILEQHFPYQKDDENELHDLIIK